MVKIELPGVITVKNRMFTKNLDSSKGEIVYNEQLKTIDGLEYRSWNPYRSKLAAALQKNVEHISFDTKDHILYLGAASGTTVSHLSDITCKGMIYAVESAALPMQKLLKITEFRPNIVPILHSARHPERYQMIVPHVDCVYQDISQRDQAKIFLSNCQRFLKPDGFGILMVKARSIDVSASPKQVFSTVNQELQEANLQVLDQKPLSPFERDHAVFVIKRQHND